MSFQLQISMKRDPRAEGPGRKPAPARVTTVEIKGPLSEEGRRELREQVEALAPAGGETIVIDVLEVPCDDRDGALAFCDWICDLRRRGRPVHVAARQSTVHRLLDDLAKSPDWLLPQTGCEMFSSRKVVMLDGPSTCAVERSGP